jgi:MFS family permease
LTLSLITAGVVALGLFIPRESRMGEEAILPLRVFRNGIFNVASTTSFLVGAVMFGGLTAVPLYLQIVRGKSPTAAGLLMVPFMVGIVVSSQTSGRLMGRTGRYKIFPIVGTAVMAVGVFLFATLKYDTPIWHAEAFMVIMGLGLGLTMQTLVISVQNALPARDMGIATSSVTFFRSMGATFGVATALAILFGSVLGNIKQRATEAGLPPALLSRFDKLSGLNDTSVIATLPSAVQKVILQGFADSMHTVFVVVGVLLIPAFVLTFFIKEVPLRTSSGLAAANEAALEERSPLSADRAEAASAVV